MDENVHDMRLRRSSLTAAQRKFEEFVRVVDEQTIAEIVIPERRRTAYHEAAHAVAAYHVGVTFERVTIASAADRIAAWRDPFEPGVKWLGAVHNLPLGVWPGMRVDRTDRLMVARVRHAIMVALAGHLAMRRLAFDDGEPCDSLGEDWIGDRWDHPYQARNELEEEGGTDYEGARDHARSLDEQKQKIEAELCRCIRRVMRLLSLASAWRAVDRIAIELLATDELSPQAVLSICFAERVPFARAVPGCDRKVCRLIAAPSELSADRLQGLLPECNRGTSPEAVSALLSEALGAKSSVLRATPPSQLRSRQ